MDLGREATEPGLMRGAIVSVSRPAHPGLVWSVIGPCHCYFGAVKPSATAAVGDFHLSSPALSRLCWHLLRDRPCLEKHLLAGEFGILSPESRDRVSRAAEERLVALLRRGLFLGIEPIELLFTTRPPLSQRVGTKPRASLATASGNTRKIH